MKPIARMCLVGLIGFLAASGEAIAGGGAVRILGATDGAPPTTSDQTMQGQGTRAITNSAPTAESAKKRDDSAITRKVQAELLATKGLRPTGIRVRTENGVVHLEGKVQNDSEKLTALNAVRAVDGVQSVVDDLQVGK